MPFRPAILLAIFTASAITVSAGAADAPESAIDAAKLQFFEAKVRPLLVENCYACHSANAKKLKANLLLDTPAGILKGGDSGPAIAPGEPDKSRLIDAIRYQNVDLQMPPKKKLADPQIADLTAWVRMGAPLPQHGADAAAVTGAIGFDLHKRRASHWSWQPVRPVPPPAVKNPAWPQSDIDRYVLAKLEDKSLTPAPPADRRTLVRRVFFDLTGLPPTPHDVEQFVNDPSANALESLIDRLLASPHFGERWGRHWLDLVRFAETYGHEFDYPIPNARQYASYVIRAINADVSFDQFARENVAGDLLPSPRLNPEQGFNESIIGSGFWFLGEQVHSPVDVRQHQADRTDNQIDVFGKTFLGLTVACARCHDHKFDAISTKDYYALYGVLESTRVQQAFLDPSGKVNEVVARLNQIRAEANQLLCTAHPPASPASAGTSFESFNGTTYQNWFPTGWAFGDGPTPPNEWDSTQRTPRLTPPGVAHSGLLSPKLRGVLRSRSFILPQHSIDYRLAGAGPDCKIRVIIDGYTMDAYNGVLFPGISFPVETRGKFKWHRQDVKMYAGHRAHIEIIDDGDGWIAVDEIRLNNEETPKPSAAEVEPATSVLPEAVEHRLAELHDRLNAESQNLVEPMRALAAADGEGVDGKVFLRGSHKNPGESVPRRFLEALGGTAHPPPTTGSGRLEIARQLTDPSNPLVARVFVNRVWHHLLGRGIVPTVDDFGVMGQPPTHPELLDYLADRFVREGWSLKRLIREIMLTSTYQMASVSTDPLAREIDPQNTLIHHMPVRRLEAEAIRDSILAVSGRLDATVYAEPVEVYLTPFMEGRGRPQQGGPLDGDGKRSIYTTVRRNFLSPMMLAFDYPVPFNTIGRRSVSNVPAQALILLNDPFVLQQAKVWAKNVLAEPWLTPRQRIERMYQQAFARPPTGQEADEAIAFLHAQGEALGLSADDRVTDPRAWADLAHVLFNAKEFIFVN